MIVLKISMIAIALVVITTIHHGSAKSQCERILSSGTWFKMGSPKRVPNFKNAYKNVSIKDIEVKFEIAPNDSTDTRNNKLLKQELMTSYFLDLYKKNKMPLVNMLSPYNWCETRVELFNQDMQRLVGDFNSLTVDENESVYDSDLHEAHREICSDHVIEYLFENSNNINIEQIFKILYENWSDDLIWKDIKAYRETDPQSPEADKIQFYSLGYFQYFANDYVSKAKKTDAFKSIEDFCSDYYNQNKGKKNTDKAESSRSR